MAEGHIPKIPRFQGTAYEHARSSIRWATGGRPIEHARYHWLLLDESDLTRPLFGAMVRWKMKIPVHVST